MTAPTIAAQVAAVSGGTATNSFEIAAPSGTTEGDLEIIVACIEDSAGSSNFTTPSGWTQLYNQRTTSGTPHRQATWWRIAPASPGAITVEWSEAARRSLRWRARITGYDATTPIPTIGTILDTTQPTDSGPSWEVAGITTPTDDCLLLLPTFISFGQFTGTPKFPAPTNWSLTDLNDNSNFNAGQPAGAVFSRTVASAGAVSAATVTPGSLSGGSSGARGVTGVMFAIAPAAAPPPPSGRAIVMIY